MKKRVLTGEPDRSLPYPIHVHVMDDGTEYEISVPKDPSGGFSGPQFRPTSKPLPDRR